MDRCKYCQSTNLVLESRIPGQDVLTANQVALRCGDCGMWLKWCPKDERQLYIDSGKAICEKYQIDKELFKALKEHDRKIEERVLFDVLGILYFQDYNRACDYDKMTGAEVVEAQHKILKEIQERYNYDFDRDFRP